MVTRWHGFQPEGQRLWRSMRVTPAPSLHAKFAGHSLPAISLALLPYAGHPTEHATPLPQYNPASRTVCSSDVMTAHVLSYGESCDSRMHPCDQYAFMIDNPPTAYVICEDSLRAQGEVVTESRRCIEGTRYICSPLQPSPTDTAPPLAQSPTHSSLSPSSIRLPSPHHSSVHPESPRDVTSPSPSYAWSKVTEHPVAAWITVLFGVSCACTILISWMQVICQCLVRKSSRWHPLTKANHMIDEEMTCTTRKRGRWHVMQGRRSRGQMEGCVYSSVKSREAWRHGSECLGGLVVGLTGARLIEVWRGRGQPKIKVKDKTNTDSIETPRPKSCI